mgnify:CR=1 FL=1
MKVYENQKGAFTKIRSSTGELTMNSVRIHLSGRKVISLVVAILILALTATPALAWEDKDGHDFGSSPAAGIVLKARAGDFPSQAPVVAPVKTMRRGSVSTEPSLRPSLARAE